MVSISNNKGGLEFLKLCGVSQHNEQQVLKYILNIEQIVL